MRVRPVFLVFNLMPGFFTSGIAIALTPVISYVDHPGSQQQVERAYVDAYEQSGFRLADRYMQNGYGDSWVIRLTFELTGVSHADDVAGTTLEIFSGPAPALCRLSRLGYVAPDAGNADPAVHARAERALAEADAAALTKVRQRLGVSLPEIPLELDRDATWRSKQGWLLLCISIAAILAIALIWTIAKSRNGIRGKHA